MLISSSVPSQCAECIDMGARLEQAASMRLMCVDHFRNTDAPKPASRIGNEVYHDLNCCRLAGVLNSGSEIGCCLDSWKSMNNDSGPHHPCPGTGNVHSKLWLISSNARIPAIG